MNTYILLPCTLALFALSGCGKTTPNCSDTKVLDTVSRLIKQKLPNDYQNSDIQYSGTRMTDKHQKLDILLCTTQFSTQLSDQQVQEIIDKGIKNTEKEMAEYEQKITELKAKADAMALEEIKELEQTIQEIQTEADKNPEYKVTISPHRKRNAKDAIAFYQDLIESLKQPDTRYEMLQNPDTSTNLTAPFSTTLRSYDVILKSRQELISEEHLSMTRSRLKNTISRQIRYKIEPADNGDSYITLLK
ncbi:hypothetical protein [Lonepinella sp. BR2474]|uniref:hypothetical protein n=1 Tax=Lonepinella sp. BR2474 TaxID=3434548 RepID=UPI003F6DDF3A